MEKQAVSQEMTAKEIVTKSYNLFLGKSSFSMMTLTIVRPEWQRSISLQNWSMGTDYYLTLIKIGRASCRERV